MYFLYFYKYFIYHIYINIFYFLQHIILCIKSTSDGQQIGTVFGTNFTKRFRKENNPRTTTKMTSSERAQNLLSEKVSCFLESRSRCFSKSVRKLGFL